MDLGCGETVCCIWVWNVLYLCLYFQIPAGNIMSFPLPLTVSHISMGHLYCPFFPMNWEDSSGQCMLWRFLPRDNTGYTWELALMNSMCNCNLLLHQCSCASKSLLSCRGVSLCLKPNRIGRASLQNSAASFLCRPVVEVRVWTDVSVADVLVLFHTKVSNFNTVIKTYFLCFFKFDI
jgi:hypothetical protein